MRPDFSTRTSGLISRSNTHNSSYTSAKAFQDEKLRRYGPTAKPLEPGRHGLREKIGQRVIVLGERIAGINSQEKLGEAA